MYPMLCIQDLIMQFNYAEGTSKKPQNWSPDTVIELVYCSFWHHSRPTIYISIRYMYIAERKELCKTIKLARNPQQETRSAKQVYTQSTN